MHRRIILIAAAVVVAAAGIVALWLLVLRPSGPGYVFSAEGRHLVVEFLDEDLAHFEYSDGSRPAANRPIFTSLMVFKQDYPGPQRVERPERGVLQTAEMRVTVDRKTLCITVSDINQSPELVLSTFCPYNFEQEFHGFTYTTESFTQVYGLGEKFLQPGSTDGDWVGQSRYPGEFGNVQEGWNNGSVGNDQFPVAYMAGKGKDSYALFVDNAYKQFWDFSQDPWKAVMFGEQVRFYVLTGPDLPDLRQDFMELVGRPPVPPQKAFGLWVSEYGYDNWDELEDKLATLRENHVPVDGFVLDLQWYGGIKEGSDDTRQGSLSWDLNNFPYPVRKIEKLKEQGIGLIVIEQPYVGRNLPEHRDLAAKGYLVRECEDCEPVYLTKNPWWGKGGMLDFSNPEAAAYWHDAKRESLIEAGILGHWTDLGEPELYDPDGWYAGVANGDALLHSHQDVHNLYNLLWAKSIHDGYQRNGHTQRPFILSRSGTIGSQRYGAALWSGDISGLLSSLATHLNVQMHMSFSGIDYYGSDIGGFWRQGGDEDETYTQWLANSALLDTPVRAHTFNLCNCQETAPDRIGDLRSNLQSVRLRYALSPYYYSLAHRAYLYGEPLIAPLVYYYQDDPAVREMGGEKMIGKDLLAASLAESGQFDLQVYLPAGAWVDFHSGQWIESAGEWFGPVNAYPDGVFTLPLYARAGAIIPQMYVDEATLNILGQRADGTRRDELIVRVYASEAASEFTLYEDDGATTAYQEGAVRTTLLSQRKDGETVEVIVGAAEGTYTDAAGERDNVILLFVDAQSVRQVSLNGTALTQVDDVEALERAGAGWLNLGPGQIMARSGELPVGTAKQFLFTLEPAEVAEAPASAGEPLPAYWPDEGWRASAPEEQGLDSAQLVKAVEYLRDQKMDTHQALVIRNGYIIVDAAFARLGVGQAYDRRSASQVVLATLTGIAIREGYIENVDQPVVDFFPGQDIANLNPAKRSLTVEHLLTMTTGFACNDNAGENSTAYLMLQSEDPVQFMLDLPVNTQPGTVYNFCTGASHLLSAVLQQSTGMTAFAFAQQYLFAPLNIESAEWTEDAQGVSVGGIGLSMDLEDTAKIGLLYLRGGVWGGVQVVPEAWVAQAITPFSPELPVGYGWMLDPAGYFDVGHHRQTLIVLPGQDMIVALSGGFTDKDGLETEVLVRSLIFPAIRANNPLPPADAAYAALQDTIATAGVAPEAQPVPALPATADRISGKRFLMEGGPEEPQQIYTLEFPGGSEAVMVQTVGDNTVRLPIGLDGLYRIFTLPVDFADLVMGDAPALKGAWVGENEFLIDFIYVQTRQKGQVRITVEGDQMRLEILIGSVTVDVVNGNMMAE